MNQDKIWEFFQNSASGVVAFELAEPRYRFVVNQLGSARRVLNIGVGSGGLESLLVAGGFNVYSLDPSEQAIRKLQSRLGLDDAHAKVGYSQEMPFADRQFDAVVMTEVLEHLPDEALVSTVSEARRVLKTGGHFFGSVPADEDLKQHLAVCPDCGKIFHRWGHVQSFSGQRLTNVLRQDFDTVKIRRVIFGPGSSLNWKGRIHWIIRRIALALGNRGADDHYFFSAS